MGGVPLFFLLSLYRERSSSFHSYSDILSSFVWVLRKLDWVNSYKCIWNISFVRIQRLRKTFLLYLCNHILSSIQAYSSFKVSIPMWFIKYPWCTHEKTKNLESNFAKTSSFGKEWCSTYSLICCIRENTGLVTWVENIWEGSNYTVFYKE